MACRPSPGGGQWKDYRFGPNVPHKGQGRPAPCNHPAVLGMLGEQTLQEALNPAELWTLWPGATGGGQVRPGLAPGGCR